MTVSERLNALRNRMREYGIDVYIIPTADFHQSEYVGDYFKAREYITGFTGSAGTAVVTQSDARLWTDGRYFIQAAQELSAVSGQRDNDKFTEFEIVVPDVESASQSANESAGFQLMKIGEPDYPTIEEYLNAVLFDGRVLGFDGRVVSVEEGKRYAGIARKNGAEIRYDLKCSDAESASAPSKNARNLLKKPDDGGSGCLDLVGEVWTDRPAMSTEPAFALDIKYTGETTASKLARIRKVMSDNGADLHAIATLDDLCWILNIRGNDIEYFPLVLMYGIISMDRMDLYIDEGKLDNAAGRVQLDSESCPVSDNAFDDLPESRNDDHFNATLRERLEEDGIVIHPYNQIYDDIRNIGQGMLCDTECPAAHADACSGASAAERIGVIAGGAAGADACSEASAAAANRSNKISSTSISDTAISDTSVSDTSISDSAISYISVSDTSINDSAISYISVSDTSVSDTSINDSAISIMIDPDRFNYALYRSIPAGVRKIEIMNPSVMMKAAKNDVELENIRRAQIKDSIAHIRFMKWLKENYGKAYMDELSVSDKLNEFRRKMGNYLRPSFDPISAYGEHCAIIHYSSTPETNVKLQEGNFLLTDTGAGYMEGSTDITRTYAIGELTQEMKEHFTLVAISNLRLANAVFLEGCTGSNLDILARQPIWERGLNYNHGTGHGVGYLMNIHEAPFNFRYKSGKAAEPALVDGLVITDEPGIYVEGSHGIRLENELLCRRGTKCKLSTANGYCNDSANADSKDVSNANLNADSKDVSNANLKDDSKDVSHIISNAVSHTGDYQFMHFETLTFIPFDLDAIDASVMSDADRTLLNEYHAQVYEKIAPYLDDDERRWLKIYTRAI